MQWSRAAVCFAVITYQAWCERTLGACLAATRGIKA
jgi:hypothetical protein